MAPKKKSAAARKESGKIRCDKEWRPSTIGEADLLVEVGLLPDMETAGWRPAKGELFPMPNSDEQVVFEDFYWLFHIRQLEPYACYDVDPPL